MKGIILAGNPGNNRLGDLILGVPKQLLPLYDKPMVYYPIYTLTQANIKDILIITSVQNMPVFNRALGDGSKFGARFSYAIQDSTKGIAQSIAIGRPFIGKDNFCLITGDTIIVGDSFQQQLRKAISAAEKSANATIFVANDADKEQYGKALVNSEKKISAIVGDSENNNYFSITGVYVYPNNVLKEVEKITLSERGMYEITSVNEVFYKNDKLQIQRLTPDCVWLDVNTPQTLLDSSIFVKKQQNL